MLEIFQYGFMVRALIAGGMIGLIAPLIGTFLVAKRYSLMADTLAHVSLAGVALGLVLGMFPTLTAVLVTVTIALVIEYLRSKQKIAGEVALAMFLSGGLAVAIVLLSFIKQGSANIVNYLFGSITTVSLNDVYLITILAASVIGGIVMFYKELMYISFDDEAAYVSGVPTRFLNTLLMVMTAMTVSIAMRIVGILLVGALMVIPVVTAMQFRQSFLKTLLISVGISVISVFSGIVLSYYANIATGGTIVIVALALFLLSSVVTRR